MVESAQEAADRALQTAPRSALVQSAAGDVYFRSADLPAAEMTYKAAIGLDGRLGRAWLGIGRVFRTAAMRKTAHLYFQRAYELDPNDPEIIFRQAMGARTSAERIRLLEQYLELGLNEDPDALTGARNGVALWKNLGDRKTFTLASPYQKAELDLVNVGENPRKPWAFGLRVTLNGKRTEWLLLDTGASGISISPGTASRIGAVVLSNVSVLGIGDRGIHVGQTSILDTVRIGPVEFRDAIVTISEKQPPGISGIIGADVFNDFLVTIDIPRMKLRLMPHPAGKSGDELTDREITDGNRSFTSAFSFGSHMMIPVSVNDSDPMLFLIDTGAFDNLLSEKKARTVSKVRNDDRLDLQGLSGRIKDVFTVDRAVIRFASFQQRNQDVVAFNFDALNKSFGIEMSGILGLSVLKLMSITIDYRNGLIDFKPSSR